MVIMLVIIYDDYGGDQLPWFTFYGDSLKLTCLNLKTDG